MAMLAALGVMSVTWMVVVAVPAVAQKLLPAKGVVERITVEVGAQTFTVRADELAGAARAELWPKLVAEYPTLGEHQVRTTRRFPVFMLTRQD